MAVGGMKWHACIEWLLAFIARPFDLVGDATIYILLMFCQYKIVVKQKAKKIMMGTDDNRCGNGVRLDCKEAIKDQHTFALLYLIAQAH